MISDGLSIWVRASSSKDEDGPFNSKLQLLVEAMAAVRLICFKELLAADAAGLRCTCSGIRPRALLRGSETFQLVAQVLGWFAVLQQGRAALELAFDSSWHMARENRHFLVCLQFCRNRCWLCGPVSQFCRVQPGATGLLRARTTDY